jgi:hypothetical protein
MTRPDPNSASLPALLRVAGILGTYSLGDGRSRLDPTAADRDAGAAGGRAAVAHGGQQPTPARDYPRRVVAG